MKLAWIGGCLGFALACGGGGGGADTQTAPLIGSFTATPTPITAGAASTLMPVFANGTGSIASLGPVTSGTGVPTGILAATTVFTLTVTSPSGVTTSAQATVTVAPSPSTPAITAAAGAAPGATGLLASVPAQAGCTYTWTIANGSITAGSGTRQITFSAGSQGSVQLGCTVTNAAGTPSAPASATVTIDPAPDTPVITAVTSAVSGATGLIASVPAQAGCTYAWTIANGSITAGSGTDQITFSAGTSGTVQLGCTVTNAAGTASAPASATVAIAASSLQMVYAGPTDATAWRLVQDSASTPAHLVLDLLAPTGAAGRGVTLILTADAAQAAWAKVDGSSYAVQDAYSTPAVQLARTSGAGLRILISQAGGTAASYGASPVLQVALELTAGATAGTVALTATQAGHLGATSSPAAISVLVGGLQAR